MATAAGGLATAVYADGHVPAGEDTVVAEEAAEVVVVRDDLLPIAVAPGGRLFTKSTGNFTERSITIAALLASSGYTCRGDDPLGTSSPYSTVTVTGPDGEVVLDAVSPVKATDGTVVEPQPAPNATNYRMGAWSTALDLAGRAPGLYTITTEEFDKVKTVAHGECTTGTPDGPTTFVEGSRLTTEVFEYRPWQQQFADFFGGGTIGFNTDPKEFSWSVGGKVASIVSGSAADSAMTLYSAPEGPAALPADPAGCQADPAGCLPTGSTACDPADGCQPRIVLINHSAGTDTLVGVFDLETRAFAAVAATGGATRVLASGGAVVDEALRTTYAEVVAAATEAGINIAQLLARPIVLKVEQEGETHEVSVSLLEGIQFTTRETTKHPAGPEAAAAGLIIHIGAWSGPDLGDGQGSGYGYTVQEAGLLPAIPSGLPSAAQLLVSGGKVRHVVGKMPDGGGQHIIALSADTSPGEPNGLPLWIPVASGAGTVADSGVEFIGDDMVILSIEVCILGTCGGGGLLMGSGVALFPGSPLDSVLSISDLPVWNDCTLAVAEVACPAGPVDAVADVDAAVAEGAAAVLGNPTVQETLAAVDPIIDPLIEQALGGVPDLP